MATIFTICNIAIKLTWSFVATDASTLVGHWAELTNDSISSRETTSTSSFGHSCYNYYI